MAYYTERHGMRKPVVKTYDISIEKYALLFHCCESIITILLGNTLHNVPMVRDAVAWTKNSLNWICGMKSPHFSGMVQAI